MNLSKLKPQNGIASAKIIKYSIFKELSLMYIFYIKVANILSILMSENMALPFPKL